MSGKKNNDHRSLLLLLFGPVAKVLGEWMGRKGEEVLGSNSDNPDEGISEQQGLEGPSEILRIEDKSAYGSSTKTDENKRSQPLPSYRDFRRVKLAV